MSKKNSLIHLNIPDIIPFYKPKRKRLPYKRLTLVLWFIGVLGLLMLGVVSLSFNSYLTLGEEASVGGKAGVKVDVPLVKEHSFTGEVNLGVKTPETTTTMLITTSTQPPTTTSTTTTLEYTGIPVDDVLTTSTTQPPVRDYTNKGVSYVYNRDKDWLGPCGSGGLGR